MIGLSRLPLDEDTETALQARQEKVNSSSDPKATAAEEWRKLGSKRRRALLSNLRSMASGIERCMYCEDSGGTDIEHFRPKSTYPAWAFQWENYLLACSHCNSNEKRNQFPLLDSGQPALIDPTVVDPSVHLIFSPTTGRYEARDGDIIAARSIEVFGLNRQVCTQGRQDMWDNLLDIIASYEARPDRRAGILGRISRYPFQGVRLYLRRTWESSRRDILLPAETIEVLTRYPELL